MDPTDVLDDPDLEHNLHDARVLVGLTFDEPLTEQDRREQEQCGEFLESIASGVGPLHSALAVGWSPAELRKRMQDADFADLVQMAQTLVLETVEHALYVKAAAGNMMAIKMVLYNRRSGTWRDVRHIETTTSQSLDPGVVKSVAQAARELLRSEGVKALQPTAEIVDGEVVDDDADT